MISKFSVSWKIFESFQKLSGFVFSKVFMFLSVFDVCKSVVSFQGFQVFFRILQKI